MFGGHLPELVILLVVALVIFGPKRLPEIGGAMGKGIKEFRKGTQELEDKATGQTQVVPPTQVASQPIPQAPVQPVQPAPQPAATVSEQNPTTSA